MYMCVSMSACGSVVSEMFVWLRLFILYGSSEVHSCLEIYIRRNESRSLSLPLSLHSYCANGPLIFALTITKPVKAGL